MTAVEDNIMKPGHVFNIPTPTARFGREASTRRILKG